MFTVKLTHNWKTTKHRVTKTFGGDNNKIYIYLGKKINIY